jgi:hypothetical protein
MGFESTNLFNRAIRPFGFDGPFLAVAEYYEEDRFVRNLGQSENYCRLSQGLKTGRLC